MTLTVSPSYRRIAVLGGTGFVGRAVCEAFSRGTGPLPALRVPTRHPAHAQSVRHLPAVEWVTAQVHREEELQRVLQGCDAVVNLVAILHGSEAEFQQVHVELPQKVARACQALGIRRVVHVSALGVGPQAPSRYLRSKAAGEAVWQASGLPVSLLRPSVIFGAHDRFLNLFARMQSLAPVVPLAGAHARFQPVWVNDVAQAVVNVLQQAHPPAVVECAGPEVLSLAELVQLAGRLSGHPRPVLPLPDWAAQCQALALEALPGPPLMSRDNLASMTVPNVATGQWPGLSSLGIEASSVHAVAPTYLAPRQGCERLNAWRARR